MSSLFYIECDSKFVNLLVGDGLQLAYGGGHHQRMGTELGNLKIVEGLHQGIAGHNETVVVDHNGAVLREDVGYLEVKDGEVSAELLRTVTGVHDVYFLFAGSGYELVNWSFGK